MLTPTSVPTVGDRYRRDSTTPRPARRPCLPSWTPVRPKRDRPAVAARSLRRRTSSSYRDRSPGDRFYTKLSLCYPTSRPPAWSERPNLSVRPTKLSAGDQLRPLLALAGDTAPVRLRPTPKSAQKRVSYPGPSRLAALPAFSFLRLTSQTPFPPLAPWASELRPVASLPPRKAAKQLLRPSRRIGPTKKCLASLLDPRRNLGQ